MTLQWTSVALFLYAEIAVLLILCLPFISARRWQKIFQMNIWNRMSRFWNRFFLTMIIILIVLFLDAVREVRKYAVVEPIKDRALQPGAADHRHMKLFRAQRNLYISGFSLFLWLVMRRVITLINKLAESCSATETLQTQADSASKAAKKYMEDNDLLKESLVAGKGDDVTEQGMKLLQEEVEKLRGELRSSEEGLERSQAEAEALKTQNEGLSREYDRLLMEIQALQNHYAGEDKKDN